MKDEDIEQFIKAYDDFMKHSEENIDSHNRWVRVPMDGTSRVNCFDNILEKKAAELEVTVDYYLAEFM